ncbi:putative transcriptional regulator with HTH domain [Galbibacter orientalis DSM 19592]|uniref:Putative transcriptional regulator with HTH domain n=1 Tax=Galbibacter orientalis DSM 19592 TaxID=926559 RepID=I3C5A4_9FLAO|nr:ATP-binding protein [Galbibacter orientalis]EIJ38797.1 putative transcriptional regulator with HTH domain [Galbibacter orientalis DSM 19592]
MSERQNIEWKKIWHDDYLKWVCGFANAIGGVIYIGKDDNGNVVHLENYQALMEYIPNKIRSLMGIICDVNLLEENANKYIEIKVNPYSVPVSLRGRYYYRSGSVKSELTGIELNEFLLKKAGKTWDDVVEEGAGIQDIDDGSINQFIEDSREKGRLPDTTGLSSLQILDKLRLTEKGKLKRAALILFGKDPNRFYPNVMVKIGRFGIDSSDLKFQEVVEGNLVHLLNEVQVQLNYKFLTRPVDFAGLHRIEKGEYPVAALREMLLNGLVHKTYMGTSIQIRVYDDKLSIWNEGVLPQGLDLESLKSEHNSRPRNPKIADSCFKSGYIDTWGRGTLKIINSCKEAALPEPEIIEKDGGVQVTLFKKNQESSPVKIENNLLEIQRAFGAISDRIKLGADKNKEFLREHFEVIAEELRESFRLTSGKLHESFGLTSGKYISNTALTLELITITPEIKAEEIGAILDVSERTVQTYLKKLKEDDFIERIGGRKEGYWQIIKQDS